MMKSIESRVSVISRNNASGAIKEIKKYGAITYLVIRLDSGELITTIESDVQSELIDPTPIDLLRNANFQSKEIFIVSSVINKMYGNSNDIIATLKASKTSFLPYQFKPLSKFLKSDNRRILIADEVGLGKTIEAGYILAELSLRGQVKNCLVVCKSSLKEKWKIELKEKFGFDFEIYKRKDLINDIIKDANTGTESILGIINYDYKLKESNELIETLETKQYQFDLLIIDEAHILRNDNTIKHAALKKIIDSSKNTILLTATPVMTALTNLYSLVKLIEPRYNSYSYGNSDFGYSLFMDHLALSQPFIEAINNLNNGKSHTEVIEELTNKEINLRFSLLDGTFNYSTSIRLGERFANDPLFQSVIEFASKKNLGYSEIALLQKRLSELNSFQDIITRTRRREIQTDIQKVTRDAQKRVVNFSAIEKDIYDSIIEDYEGEPLVLVQKKRQATSCLPAFIEKHNLFEEEYETIVSNDTKFNELFKIIKEVVIQRKKKIIIFSFFKGTLAYLQKRLQNLNITTVKIDGDVKVSERQKTIEEFKTNQKISILLASEVGSEGLDMQFCDALVNYDLPWNPMIIEQRIGRIDRFGQKSDVIHIYNLCIAGSIEEQIFERLLERINIFRESIGNLEDILTTEGSIFETNEGLEAELYGRKLSKDGRERKLRDIEIALQNAELQRKEIEESLDESFLNDQYISDEIEAINKQKRYITNDDILSIMTLVFQIKLATLRCDFYSPEKYINIEKQQEVFFDFISENIPSRKENPQLFQNFLNFKKKNFLREQINFTFNQEEAFENKSLEFLSPTHPLVQATFQYFKGQNFIRNNAFFFCIDPENLPLGIKSESIYILAKYKMEVLKYTMAKSDPDKSFFELQMMFILNENGEFTGCSEELTNTFLSTDIKHWYVNPNELITEEEGEEIEKLLMQVLVHDFFVKKINIETDLKNTHQSRQFRLIDTEIDFLNRQIERDKKTIIDDPENSIKFIYEKRIQQYNQKINELNKQKNKVRLVLNDTLQSITVIKTL